MAPEIDPNIEIRELPAGDPPTPPTLVPLDTDASMPSNWDLPSEHPEDIRPTG